MSEPAQPESSEPDRSIEDDAFAGLMRGYEQAKRGEFYEGTIEDIIREAKAAREVQDRK